MRMASASERVKLMKQDFMKYHNEGRTIPEIARIFQISVTSIYHNLQEIADENGLSRDTLLCVVHKPHEVKNMKIKQQHEKIDSEKLLRQYDNAIDDLNQISSMISYILDTTNKED